MVAEKITLHGRRRRLAVIRGWKIDAHMRPYMNTSSRSVGKAFSADGSLSKWTDGQVTRQSRICPSVYRFAMAFASVAA